MVMTIMVKSAKAITRYIFTCASKCVNFVSILALEILMRVGDTLPRMTRMTRMTRHPAGLVRGRTGSVGADRVVSDNRAVACAQLRYIAAAVVRHPNIRAIEGEFCRITAYRVCAKHHA